MHRALESSLRLQKLCMHYLFMGWRGLGLPNWYLNGILDAVAAHLGCLECCQADFHGFSLIFVDFHRFAWIFIDFMDSRVSRSDGLWRPVAACGTDILPPLTTGARFWQASRLAGSQPRGLDAWRLGLLGLLGCWRLRGWRDTGMLDRRLDD